MELSRIALATLAILTWGSQLPANPLNDDNAQAPNQLGFLEADKDYVIRFPPDYDVFKTTKGGVTQTTYTTQDGERKTGRPATWSMTLTVEIFRVVRFGGGSWVLVEHPSDADDFAKWNGKRRAMAMLTNAEQIRVLEAEPEGRQRLAKLREAADREIETSQTWVNLNHAVAIAEVPTEDVQVQLKVQSVTIPSKD